MTYSMPPQRTAHTGIDVLAHAIEACITVHSNPCVKLTALGAMGLVSRWLPEAVANGDNPEARGNMAWASTVAGCPGSPGLTPGGIRGTVHV